MIVGMIDAYSIYHTITNRRNRLRDATFAIYGGVNFL